MILSLSMLKHGFTRLRVKDSGGTRTWTLSRQVIAYSSSPAGFVSVGTASLFGLGHLAEPGNHASTRI